MLKRLHLRNFTVFADAEFEFGEGLNVLVGTNGTGKTHVLKAGYAMWQVLFDRLQEIKQSDGNKSGVADLILWTAPKKVKNVFQLIPSDIRELIRHSKGLTTRAEVVLDMQFSNNEKVGTDINFATIAVS